jgi:hypothetical protein
MPARQQPAACLHLCTSSASRVAEFVPGRTGYARERASPHSAGCSEECTPVHGDAAAGLQQLPIERGQNADIVVAAGGTANNAAVLIDHFQELPNNKRYRLQKSQKQRTICSRGVP